MKNRGISALVFAAFVLLFSSLLISGAPRLIASESAAKRPVLVRPVAAYLCSPAASCEQAEGEANRGRGDLSARMDAAVLSAQLHADLHAAPGSDANGNVLRAVSYMRSVYQAFALGDGFA